MTDGVTKFIEYLDHVNEMIELFKGISTASEILSSLPLTEEQVELSNMFLEKIQKEWSDGFIPLLEFGVKWLKKNDELEE